MQNIAEGWQTGLGGEDHYIMGFKSLCGRVALDTDNELNEHQELPVCIECVRGRWDI